jgi:hypothetical protein
MLILPGYWGAKTPPGGESRHRSLGSRPVSTIRPRLIGVVLTTGLLVASASELTIEPVEAATEGSLQARATAIESRITAESATLHRSAITYLAEQQTYKRSVAAETNTKSLVKLMQRSVDQRKAEVRSAAITTYVNAGAASPIGLYLDGRPDTLSTGAAYTKAANDHVESSIAALTSDEITLSANLKVERVEVTQSSAALAATAASRQSVYAAMNSESFALSSVNGALAALVREQEIAQERAAAQAAARAAAVAAADSPTLVVTAGPPPIASSPIAPSTSAPSSLSAAFASIRRCESSGNYSLNTGNGYFGAYQFSAATWTRLGGSGLASSASPAAQDAAAYQLYQSSGWAGWPECAAVSGL